MPSMNPAFYDPRSQKWQFSNHPKSKLGFYLYPTNEPESILRPSVQLDDPAASTRKKSKTWWSRCLAQDAPETGPAMAWIDNYFEESQIVATNTNISDPTIGRLLAFGTAVAKEGHGERSVNVAAFPRGNAGTHLVLSEMENQEWFFKYSEGVELVAPQIMTTTEMPAYTFRSAIRQVCFAGNPYFGDPTNPRLAVRTSGETTIFKQVRLPLPIYGQPNRLYLQPLITLNPRISGESSDHVDVAFNPFYDRQFGTIDQKGYWKVWDIEGAYDTFRQSSGLTLRNSAKGCITQEENVGEGWGRFLWGGDSNSILTCDRQRAALVDLRTDPMLGSNIIFPTGRDRNWILDLHRAPNSSAHEAFLLTSSEIIWIDTRQLGRPLFNRPHRRHRDDVSMYLELLYSNNVITTIIGSRMNFLTTCYEFSSLGVQRVFPTFLNDPYMLLPPFSHDNSTNAAINMAILPCLVNVSRNAISAASEYEARNIHFFSGLSITKELGISQRIYSTKEFKMGDITRRNQSRFTKSAEFVDEDTNIAMASAEIGDTQMFRVKNSGNNGHRRTNFREIYKLAFVDPEELGFLRTAQDNDEANSVTGFMGRLADILASRVDRADLGISSLLEVREPLFLFNKLSDLQTKLPCFLGSQFFQKSYQLKSLLPAKPIGLPHLGPSALSLVAVYENILTTWVSQLSISLPGRVRLRRERLARLVSTNIFLASRGLGLKPSYEALQPPNPTQDHRLIYPVTPSLEAKHGLARNIENIIEPLEGIRAYAHVQSRIILVPDLQNVLNSWKVGEYPADFDYFVDPDEGVPRYQKNRRRVRKVKKISNSQARERGETSKSQPPTLMNARSLLGSGRDGSNQSLSQPFTMSQVGRVKCGGRKPQKRKTGF